MMYIQAVDILLSKLRQIQNSIASQQEEIADLKKREADAIQQLEDNKKTLDDVRQAISALGGNPDQAPRSSRFGFIGSSAVGERLAS